MQNNESIEKEKNQPIYFDDPRFQRLCPYFWFDYYPGVYQDQKTALNFLYLFDSKTKFIDHFQLDEPLVKWTSTWTFEEFAGSFVYHYTVSQLQNNNYVLTAYHWEKIFNFSLNLSCSKMIFSILEDNNFSRCSKKTKHY